jgi:hypothetical protein
MSLLGKRLLVLGGLLAFVLALAGGPDMALAAKVEKKGKAPAAKAASTMETWAKPNAVFDASKMGAFRSGCGEWRTGLGLCELCRP